MCPEPFDKLRTAPVEGHLARFDKLSAHSSARVDHHIAVCINEHGRPFDYLELGAPLGRR